MSNKLRYWVRLDSENIPVVGSNVNRPRRPKFGKWKEIEKVDCCGQTLTYAAAASTVAASTTAAKALAPKMKSL